MNTERIYGILVTGKYSERKPLALVAIDNFFNQTYPNKHLIIINTDNEKYNEEYDEVTEILVNQGKKKLGDLRNMGLDQIKKGDLWVQWDDDDYKSPELLEKQYNKLKEKNGDYIVLKNQIRYSFKKHTAKVQKQNVIHGTIMGYKSGIKYPSQKKGEDTQFLNRVSNKKKLVKFDNKPELYIRNIHFHNTWGDDHFNLKNWPKNTLRGYDSIINSMLKEYKKFNYPSK